MADLEELTRQLAESASKIQQEMRLTGPFHSYIFRRLILAASEISKYQNLIQ